MPKPFDDLRVLLIQARNTPDIEQQEQTCFLERCRIDASQLVCLNVARTPVAAEALEGVDCVMIGGAGEYSVAEDYPWMEDLLAFTRLLYDRGVPTFGSCWGHQLIARALGGEVIYDRERTELGCHYVALTEAGREDPLFRDFPHRFLVNMGHHDRVSRLPPGAVELADNASQPNQAFRMRDRPMYGTQFHSELDAHRERERLLKYRSYYTEIETEAQFQNIMDSLAETSEVDHLLHDFLVKLVATQAD